MSEKEYKIEVNGDYVKVSEVEPSYADEPSTDPTWRENLNDKLCNMPKGVKVFLTIFFDLYGVLYRFSANTTMAVLFSLAHVSFLNPLVYIFGIIAIRNEAIDMSFGDALNVIGNPRFAFIPFLLWIVDILTVVIKNDILFIKNKTYEDYK